MSKKKNYNNNGGEDDDSEKQRTEYDYCKVCRLNHNQGRRHNYFPNHRKALSSFLSRFQVKIKNGIVVHLKNPSPVGPEHHQDSSLNRLWCVFCDSDVVESSSYFACGNAIEHLASVEHLKQVKGFLWKYGGGMDQLDSFRISESDFAKWEKKCKLVKTGAAGEASCGSFIGPSNDIQTQIKSDNVERFEINNSLDSLKFDIKFPNGVVPLQNHTNERSQVLHSEMSGVTADGPQVHHTYMGAGVGVGVGTWTPKSTSGTLGNKHFHFAMKEHQTHCPINESIYSYERSATGEPNSQDTSTGLLRLSQIPASAQHDSGGNVHTGAPPPWFSASESAQLDNSANPRLSHGRIESAKSSKLNPKRVGAAWAERRKIELEMQKRGELLDSGSDADWLPNFGRVWQSGSRKESRKQFMSENKTSRKVDNQPDNTSELQPYTSKRMVNLPWASRKGFGKDFTGKNQTSHQGYDHTSQLQPYISKRMRRDTTE